jgi:predicted RNA-binding protein YlqC (UPF0109 family)
VEEVEDGDRLVYEVKADKSIIGMIIGKDGSTIKNLRRIMAIKATLENKLIGINVTEI